MHFVSHDKGKCDSIFGYLFVVSAVFDECDVAAEEQRYADLGSSIKRELKHAVFDKISDSINFSAEFLSEECRFSKHQKFLAQLISESWDCEEALSCLRHVYSSPVGAASHAFFAQTMCQISLQYEPDAFPCLFKYHSTFTPQLHLSPSRSFGACISENFQSFIACPSKENRTAFAMSQEVFRSGQHEFSVVFEAAECSGSASCTETSFFGIGVATTSALDLDSEGVFFFSSVGEIKRMGGQTKPFQSCLQPCVGHPVHVNLDLTVPKVSIWQFGKVLIEQNLPPSLVSEGVCALFLIEFSEDPNVPSCRATMQPNHSPDFQAFQFAHFLGSIVSHKLFSDLLAAAPQPQLVQATVNANILHLQRMITLMLKRIPESDTARRMPWGYLSSSLPCMQLIFLQSCLHFPHSSQALALFLPTVDATFREAFSNSSWAQSFGQFEIQLILVLVAVTSHASRSPGTLSSTIIQLSRESPLILSMHQAMVDVAAADLQSDAFLARALSYHADIDAELKKLPRDAIILRALFERAKREAADSIVSLFVSDKNPETCQMIQSLLFVLNSAPCIHFPQLLAILSRVPSPILQRSHLPLVTAMCMKLLKGQCTYSQGAIEFATFTLCASSRGSFAASRRALKHIHSCISTVWTRPGLNVIELSRAAVISAHPSSASVLNMSFNGRSLLSFVNAGWAVVALNDSCARISVAAACVLCAVMQSNGGSSHVLSQISGIPECAVSSCLQTLIALGLVHSIDSAFERMFVCTELCAIRPSAGRFAPAFDSLHEVDLCAECNFMDDDFIAIVQAILAILPPAAFFSEGMLTLQCANLTRAAPGKITHVLSYLESKCLVCRDGQYVALMSPLLERAVEQHNPADTCSQFELPSCILQLVIVMPTYREIFQFDSSVSSTICIPRGDFETFLGKSFSLLLPLTGMDQLQLCNRFIESDACIATILISMRFSGASASSTCARSEFVLSTGFCPVCLEDEADLISPMCGHGACSVCWKSYINTALHDDNTQTVNRASEDRLHLTKLKCIADDSCSHPLSIDFLTRVSPSAASSMVRGLQRSMCRSILSASPSIVQCQFCDFVIVAPHELCEAQCSNCGRIMAVGDFKRNNPDQDWISHPNLKSGDLATWQSINQQGSIERFELMRFKKCPRCGAVTTRCGCEDGKVVCDGLERCPNERCDQ